jgi:hypothetical protein
LSLKDTDSLGDAVVKKSDLGIAGVLTTKLIPLPNELFGVRRKTWNEVFWKPEGML